MRVIAVVNQKGGVGKTTTAANIAHAMALKGYRVTAIDLDPQGHLGASYGIDTMNSSGIDLVLLQEQHISSLLIEVRANLNLLPAGSRLSVVERRYETQGIQGDFLSEAIHHNLGDEDFVFIDCPPSSGFLLVSALYAAHEVLIPVPGDYLSLHGLSHMMGTLKQFEDKLSHKPKHWVVMTRYQQRRKLTHDVEACLQQYFPGMVFETKIRETTALAECPSFGQTIFDYQRKSHGASDYQALADEFIIGRAA